MSPRQNADQSYSDSVFLGGPGPFVSHQLGVALASVQQLTVPANANAAIVQADGNDIRFRLDGTAPTATVGIIIKNGTSITLSAADAKAAKFIQVAASGNANVWYTL